MSSAARQRGDQLRQPGGDDRLLVRRRSTCTSVPVSPSGDFRILAGDIVQLRCRSPGIPVTARDQMHLDLYTREQSAEVSRLLSLGATLVRHHDDPDDDYVVLTDPEGNEFCVCALPSD